MRRGVQLPSRSRCSHPRRIDSFAFGQPQFARKCKLLSEGAAAPLSKRLPSAGAASRPVAISNGPRSARPARVRSAVAEPRAAADAARARQRWDDTRDRTAIAGRAARLSAGPFGDGDGTQMRWLGSVILAAVATVVGGFVFMQVGEGVYAFIDAYAPGYFPGCYSGLIRHSQPGFDAPRKIAWGQLLFNSGMCGAACLGSVTLLVLGLRLGGAVSVFRAYLIICLSGLAGACAGGGAGYLLGVAVPGYYRGVFRAGGEAWFDPLQVGVGLGVSQGLLVGLAVGAVVVVAVAWYRSRAPQPLGSARHAEPRAAADGGA